MRSDGEQVNYSVVFFCESKNSNWLKTLKMVISDTLLIKHLPYVLTDSGKEELLKHFGAREVKCVTSKHNKYNLVFARFDNENVAESILHRLHQINVLGSTLSVEFAKNNNIKCDPPSQSLNCSINSAKDNEKFYNQFIKKLTHWHSNVDFTQPVPSHLKYQYPPPDMQALINIIKVLATVPKFYTQVLHLMNKMNLPCPFGRDILPDIELPFFPVKGEEANVVEGEIKMPDKSSESSESELSSDEELKKQKETIPQQQIIKKKTKIKVPKFFKPTLGILEKAATKKKTSFEEVFEKVLTEKEPKKIKLTHPIPINEKVTKPCGNNESSASGFGFIHPIKKPEESTPLKDVRNEREEERLIKEQIIFISDKELAENRISEKDRLILPVFKNYAEGAPTCRLYIKNLAKTVTKEDLAYIYNRYLANNIGDEPNMFDIRLMQEGRMKGQAFVTLQTVELAQKALKETNGYILKEKPLVVQFARSATK